jgi:hypothetical protein
MAWTGPAPGSRGVPLIHRREPLIDPVGERTGLRPVRITAVADRVRPDYRKSWLTLTTTTVGDKAERADLDRWKS